VGASGAVWVTGAAGFVGGHLVPELEAAGERVLCVRKPETPPCAWGTEWLDVDLRDGGEVERAVAQTAPRAVIHLAAVAFPPDADTDPFEALRMNYCAVHHLAGALLRGAPGARLLHVSSAQVYAAGPADSAPIDEDAPLAPASLYAATKAAAEQRLVLAAGEGLDVVRARPFNHSGPGRPPLYAESSFARQIARIERGEQAPVVRVGNLEGVRDFCDVRDVVSAYRVLLARGDAGRVFNVCSGRGWSVRAVLDHLLARSRRPVQVEVDPALYRPLAAERRALVGDPRRLVALGWQPRHPFEATLDALLDDWRSRP
jgi:GDP-4-dehydro-6-deoxy-D-mannose reductase